MWSGLPPDGTNGSAMDGPAHRKTRPNAASCGIAVMAKASRAGRTKTRLSPPFSPAEAASFNTAFLVDVSANLLIASDQASIAGYMAYGPPGEGAFFDFLPGAIGRFEAWCPTFGETLFLAVSRLLDLGHVSACVLNADSPTLPPSILVEAARKLDEPGDRVVLGPASDGGYYLLGLKRKHARMFEDVAWSTEHVARQTRERAAEIGLPVHLLPEWYDVDDAGALARICDERPGEGLPTPGPATHTRALLRSLAAKTQASLDTSNA